MGECGDKLYIDLLLAVVETTATSSKEWPLEISLVVPPITCSHE